LLPLNQACQKVRGQIQNSAYHLEPKYIMSHSLVFFCNFFIVEECKDVKYSLRLIFQDVYGVLCNKNVKNKNMSRAHHKALKATWSLQAVCLTGLHLIIWQTKFADTLWNIPILNVKMVLPLLSSHQNPNIHFLQPSFCNSTFYKNITLIKGVYFYSVTATSQSHVSITFLLLILGGLNVWLYRVVLIT
jgi:hypothetical protein